MFFEWNMAFVTLHCTYEVSDETGLTSLQAEKIKNKVLAFDEDTF